MCDEDITVRGRNFVVQKYLKTLTMHKGRERMLDKRCFQTERQQITSPPTKMCNPIVDLHGGVTL